MAFTDSTDRGFIEHGKDSGALDKFSCHYRFSIVSDALAYLSRPDIYLPDGSITFPCKSTDLLILKQAKIAPKLNQRASLAILRPGLRRSSIRVEQRA